MRPHTSASRIAPLCPSFAPPQLDFSGMGFEVGDEGCRELAAVLATNTVLRRLTLSEQKIGDDGVGHLAEALTVNTTLRQLDLTENCIGGAGMERLATALERNHTLTELGICNNRRWLVGSAPMAACVTSFGSAMTRCGSSASSPRRTAGSSAVPYARSLSPRTASR